VSHKPTHCPDCGTKLIAKCTHTGCNAHVDVYSRIVGYLRPVSTWNDGKKQEWSERKEFNIKEERE